MLQKRENLKSKWLQPKRAVCEEEEEEQKEEEEEEVDDKDEEIGDWDEDVILVYPSQKDKGDE